MDNVHAQIQAKVLQQLLEHLRTRPDVQNIDLMNLAGFCRNCLSKWYLQAASDLGMPISDTKAREFVYGMNYEEWKKKYQKDPSKPLPS